MNEIKAAMFSQEYTERLKSEVKQELSVALTSIPDPKATLAARRLERISKKYNDLAMIEPEFLRIVNLPIDWDNIKPEMHTVTTTQERKLWNYARNIVSSMPENSVIGRQIRHYWIDANSGRWLGITCLASALTLLTPRHNHIKWSPKVRFRNLVKILNVAVCVPIQPFGTLCGGKLLFVASLSNEVRQEYRQKYGDDLLAVETTSLYGKSSQYNRVKEFKYLGLTGGSGNIHISDDLWNKIKQLLCVYPEHDSSGSSSVKMRKIRAAVGFLGLGQNGTQHNHRRGYYWGTTTGNAEDILAERTKDAPQFHDRPLQKLVDAWHKRWYLMRLPKKRDAVESFDLSQYELNNNVLPEMRRHVQTALF